MESHDRVLRSYVLTLFDKSLSDHAIERCGERTVVDLNVGFHDATFEPANLGFLGEDIFFAADHTFFNELLSGCEFFNCNLILRFGQLKFRTRNRTPRHERRQTISFGSNIGESRLRGTHLRFPPQAFFWSLSHSQRDEFRAGLIELSLQRRESRFELIFAHLADEVSLFDFLAFLDWEVHQEPRNLKCQLHASRGFDRAGERSDAHVVPCRDEHRLDGPNQFSAWWWRWLAAAQQCEHDER